ncbi:MAG: endonuclease III [Armatimonadota bacterium]|nr:endonuclease III [Armatimonadota bacterium]
MERRTQEGYSSTCYNIADVVDKAQAVCRALEQEYGRPRWQRRESLIDELIATILSQNTTAKQADKAFRALKERFGDWGSVRDCPLDELAEAIRVGGLAEQKARSIKAVLDAICADQGRLDLEWLSTMPDEEALKFLQSFPGVGRKTAACVLMFGLGRPVMPVDTHVYRIAVRVGLIPPQSVDRAHDVFQSLVPPEMIYSCHVNMVAHGRRVCKARNPNCHKCVLRVYCDAYQKSQCEAVL